MSLPVTIFLLILLFAGVSMHFAGLYIRRGTRPTCRRCSYDLSALTPARCPECNEDLAADGAIRLGERRRKLAWSGAAVAILALLGLAYTLIQSPRFDRLKPVGLLRAEMALVNDAGDERVIKELRRRLADPASSQRERRSIGVFALGSVRSGNIDDSVQFLLTDSVKAGAVRADQAKDLAIEMIKQWPDETVLWGDDIKPLVRTTLLSALLGVCDIDFETVRPLIVQGFENAHSTLSGTEIAELNATLLNAWWSSPGSPGTASNEYLAEYFRDAPYLTMRARDKIETEPGVVPFSIRYSLPPMLAAEGEAVAVAVKPVRARVVQYKKLIHDEAVNFGGSIMSLEGGGLHDGFNTGGFGTTLDVPGLEFGPAELQMDVRAVIVRVMPDSIPSLSLKEILEGSHYRVLVDRTVTVSTRLNVVFPGDDEIKLVMPGEGDIPDERVLLERLRFTPLRYNTSPQGGPSGPWYFGIQVAELSHELRGQSHWLWPDVTLASRVVAEQEGFKWDLGAITIRSVLHVHPRTFMPSIRVILNSQPPDWRDQRPMNRTPDFEKPVRIRLIPEPQLAKESLDIDTILGAEIDLGLFEIVPVEGNHSVYDFQDATLPAPILSE